MQSKSIYNPRIGTVSAPCGSGKTYSTCQYIADHQAERNHLIVQPTIDLINQTRETLSSMGVESFAITSETHSGKVKKSIMAYLNSAEPTGDVLLITWDSYLSLPFFAKRGNWNIFIDEVPQVDSFFDPDVHQHKEVLLDHVELHEVVNENIALVKARNSTKLKSLLANPDDVTKNFRQLFQDLANPNKEVFVDLNSWTRVFEGTGSVRVHFMSMLNPRAFEGVTLLGANVEDSLLHHWFTNYHDANFVRHTAIEKGLRYTRYSPELGKRLQICHLLKNKGHSKHLSNKKLKGSKTVGDAMDRAMLNHADGRKFIYAVNNDYKGCLLDCDHAQKINVVSHGLNNYQHETIVYFGPALNRKPKHNWMLNQLGVDDYTIKNSTLHEAAHQFLLRTALRDPKSTATVECVVPEFETACRLVEIFDGASIKWIGDIEFKKVKPFTQVEKDQRGRLQQFKKTLFPSSDGQQEHTDVGGEFDGVCTNFPPQLPSLLEQNERKGSSHGKFLSSDSSEPPNGSMCLLTLHQSKYDKKPEDFVVEAYDQQEFARQLRSWSKVPINSKEEVFMLNPTVFDDTDPEGHRRQVNFFQSSMMVLDFDDGDLSIEEFERIFWHEAGRGNKRSFVICNSFSRSDDQPNRFRVFMFYKEPARSLVEHQAVYDSIVQRLQANGYSEKASGLDPRCRDGIQSFWIPCKNRAHEDSVYFNNWGTKKDELKRCAISPSSYLKTAVVQRQKPQVVPVDIDHTLKPKPDDAVIESIKNKVKSMPEGRHLPFYQVGKKLLYMGLSLQEVEYHLADIERCIGKTSEQWTHWAIQSLQKRMGVAA